MEKKVGHGLFINRLSEAVEKELRLGRDDRGFRFAIAKKLGLANSTIQRWFDGSFPEARHFSKIYSAFGVTPDYLIGITDDAGTSSKKGFDLSKQKVRFGNKIRPLLTESTLNDPYEFTAIPFLDQGIVDRFMLQPNKITPRNVKSWFMIRSDLIKNRNNVIGIFVGDQNGDSMSPLIKPGDIALVDLDDTEVINDHFYAVATPSGCTIKMVRVCDAAYILLPINLTNHQIQSIDKTKSDPIIGRVIQTLTNLA